MMLGLGFPSLEAVIYLNWRGVDLRSNPLHVAEFGQRVGVYLSSVSPRHSYCNWASPVTSRIYIFNSLSGDALNGYID
jgi:hypothetical protein